MSVNVFMCVQVGVHMHVEAKDWVSSSVTHIDFSH